MPDAPTFSELVRQAKADPAGSAMSELLQREFDRLIVLVPRCPGVDRESVVQDTLLKVFRSLPTLRGDFERWVFRILRNTFRDAYRRAHREWHALAGLAFLPLFSAPSPAKETEWNELVSWLHALLARLSVKDQQIIRLCCFSEHSHREVAEALHITRDVSRKRLHRAIRKLAALAQEAPASER